MYRVLLKCHHKMSGKEVCVNFVSKWRWRINSTRSLPFALEECMWSVSHCGFFITGKGVAYLLEIGRVPELA
jgi:hypothetical protein